MCANHYPVWYNVFRTHKPSRAEPTTIITFLTTHGRVVSVSGTGNYNGGQKCWDLSSDITKTSDPSPPTPNKVEFGAKWVRMSAFLATTLLGGVGERRDEPKAEQKNCP